MISSFRPALIIALIAAAAFFTPPAAAQTMGQSYEGPQERALDRSLAGQDEDVTAAPLPPPPAAAPITPAPANDAAIEARINADAAVRESAAPAPRAGLPRPPAQTTRTQALSQTASQHWEGPEERALDRSLAETDDRQYAPISALPAPGAAATGEEAETRMLNGGN